MGFPGGSDGKESACNAGDLSSIPGLGRSPEEGNGNPLQYSCLENSMDRGAWQSMGLQRVGPNWVTNTFTLELYVCPYRWTVLASSLQEPSRGTSEEPGSLWPPQMHLRVFWVKLPKTLAHHPTLAHPHQCIVWGLPRRDFQTDTSKHIPNSSWESLGLQGDPTSPS